LTNAKNELAECFVLMPISDAAPYPTGHFRRVYDNLIAPACAKAGFKPYLASDVQQTNYIVLDILRRLLNAPMALCDMSARNPNVFFELGIRQAFNLPVTLLKDERTERAFDIQGIRSIEYDSNLRIDLVQKKTTISEEGALILSELRSVATRLTALEKKQPSNIMGYTPENPFSFLTVSQFAGVPTYTVERAKGPAAAYGLLTIDPKSDTVETLPSPTAAKLPTDPPKK
jgi:hypothetical protein